MRQGAPHCLVVVADDFGRSPSINRAVAEGREKGILTAASIMAGGPAFEDAVYIARKTALSVGLHVTLCDGNSVLPPLSIPDLADKGGRLPRNPLRAWLRYSLPSLLEQIDREIEAQFETLRENGIRPTHVDGHHHLHMQPSIFRIVCRHAVRRGVRWIRIPRERLPVALSGAARSGLSFAEWAVFGFLSLAHGNQARQSGLRSADRAFGLSVTGRLDEKRLLQMVARTEGVTEIFLHPDTETIAGQRELEALCSPAVRSRIASLGVRLAGYGELTF